MIRAAATLAAAVPAIDPRTEGVNPHTRQGDQNLQIPTREGPECGLSVCQAGFVDESEADESSSALREASSGADDDSFALREASFAPDESSSAPREASCGADGASSGVHEASLAPIEDWIVPVEASAALLGPESVVPLTMVWQGQCFVIGSSLTRR